MSAKRVAIVGSGCSGIGALWALTNTEHEVHLFEADSRLGGHTNTVPWNTPRGDVDVDTGFIVMNSATYPNFIKFLRHIGVKAVPTEMTFSVCRDWGIFEWAGTSLNSIFAQRSNIFSARMWQMIFDVIRFNQFALDLLAAEDESEVNPASTNGVAKSESTPIVRQTIGEYLDQHGYSDAFREDYLVPMTACVWSTDPGKVTLEFPAITLVRFLWNHHLLNTISTRPTWLTIPGGSKQYIETVVSQVPSDRIHRDTEIESVKSRAHQVEIKHAGGTEVFDHVILATHGDTTMSLIAGDATTEEKDILSAFKTTENTAFLHHDKTLLPRNRIAWASWNYLTASPTPDVQPRVSLTYNMNILQHIPTELYGDVLVTLNPLRPPRKSTIKGQWTYHHPLYNAAAIRSQKLLPRIQNKRGISYAGAWTKYGFHEDGFSSGIKVASEHLGAKIPFEFVDSTFSRGKRPRLGMKDYLVRFAIRVIQLMIVLLAIPVRLLSRRAVYFDSTGKKIE